MENQYGFGTNNPWAMPAGGTQQNYYPPQQQQQQPQQPRPPSNPNPTMMNQQQGADPMFSEQVLTGYATNVLRQQGQSYLQRSQAFMQSKIGLLSGGTIQYLFAVTSEYVRTKLLMLVFPFLKRWNYNSRRTEQLSGGHKYLPPRQDENAPDLYIPVMALWTYCLLVGFALFSSKTFKPEILYNTVWTALGAWAVHTMMLKLLLWVLGISSTVSMLELAAYAGYPFVTACIVLVAHLTLGKAGYHAVWAYGSLCMAIFLVRTMKRVIFMESNHYSHQASRHNYLLLGLATFQFAYLAWLARGPKV